jgi:kojibiose phosphorylase
VAFHLRYAAHALVRCRSERPGRWERLVRAIGVSADEASSFERTAAAIPVRVSDDGVILQSDDFSRYVDVDVRRLRRDAGGKLGVGGVASVVGQERLYRIKALKQADVVALLALFPDDFSADVKRRSYEFYEPITTHDSSLSASAHATVAAQLGKADEALDFLRQSSAVDADDEAGDASHGIHIANCGGNWQTIVYGFAGVRPAYAGEELVVQPRLPDGIDSIALPLFWRGSRLQLTVSRERVSVARTDGPPLEVRIGTDRRLVQESEEWTYE